MDRQIFDKVKHEKEKAMERFSKFQRLKKILKLFEIVFGFLLLVWSTNKIPLVVRFSSKLFELCVYFVNPHLVFLIGNSIILALFFLCKQPTVGNSTGNDDIYAYSGHSEASRAAFKVTLTSTEVDKRVSEDNVKLEEEELKMEAENVQCEAVEVAIAEAEQEIRRFQRTLSEKLKREITVRPRKELRRSETENGRSDRSGGGGGGGGRERRTAKSSLKTVEHLTNEEFKLAIDAFIDKHRVFSQEKINAELRYK